MTSKYKHCQSCGMPMKRDAQGGGTNADASKSAMYCSHCYQSGVFVLPETTPEQMQARVRAKLIEVGIPAFLTGFFTRGIPRLKRWKL